MSLSSLSKTMKRWGIAVFCLVLSACGGGSGGSGGTESKPAAGFQVSVDRTALRFDGEEGRSLSPVAVLGNGVGTTPASIYTGSLDLGTSLDRVNVEVIGTQIKFTIYPKSDLPAGTYTGSVQLFACPDAKCNQHFSGSPVSIPYTIVIAKGFKVSPQSLTLSTLSGNSTSRDLSVQLPAGQSSFEVSSSVAWLSVSNIGANGFAVKTAAMPPGNYAGTLSVHFPGRNIDIPVNFTVTGDSSTVTRIIPDVTNLDFNAIAGGAQTAPLTVNLSLPSWSTESKAEISYTSGGLNWLSLSKTSERSYTVSALPQNMSAGTYYANLTISSGPMAAPIAIPISLVVGTPSWSIVGTTNFLIDAESGSRQLSAELAVDLPYLPAQAWTASTNSAWLKLLNTSGITGSSKLQVAIDTNELLKMDNFTTYTSDVLISSASGKIAPRKLTFTINKNLPQINFISPATRLPGEASTAIVRGRGFDSVINLEQTLDVSGLPVKRITRVNDTQLLLHFDAAAQGETTVSLKNALAIPTGSATLKVVPPRSFTYRAIPTQGMKGSIHFDPARQSIFTSNKELGSVMRFTAMDGTWAISSATVPSIDSSVMSPDGKSLVTTSTNGKLSLIDPDSLETQATYSADADFIAGDRLNSLPRLAMTNNGKAYFQSRTWANGLTYFDLTTRKFTVQNSSNLQFSFYGGPWFNVSGDGDRLLIVQSASISSNPKMLYMNASDEVVKVNPAGLEFWYEGAQSLHGERFIEGTYKVWDRDFSLIGNVVLPDNAYYGRTPVFAPDGNRVYILAYHSSGFSGSDDSSVKPRVYVLDTSNRLVTTTNLPVLGYFDLNDYPTCSNSSYGCNSRALGTISPDGKTLFFIGDKNLIIAPIPALQAVGMQASIQRASKNSNSVPATMTRHDIKK